MGIINSQFLITLTSSLLLIWLIFLILVHGKAREAKRYFALMTGGIMGWIMSNYLSNIEKNYQLALLWNKLIFITTSLAGWSFLMFSYVFPEEKKPKRILFWISLITMIFVIFLSSTHFLVKRIIIKENVSEIIFGPGVYVYATFLILCLFVAFAKFISKYFATEIILIKKSIRTIGIGMSIFLICSLITNLILPIAFKKFELTNLAPFYTIFFVLALFFAIFSYEFLDTKVILTEILVGGIGILLIVQILISPNNFWKIINTFSFILFSIGGYLLIRYTFREIKRREEIEKLSQAKTEFLAIASHQLRTPLTILKGYLAMILEGDYGEVPKKIKKILENVYLSNERLIKLINDFLSATKIETGEVEMKLEKTNMEELLEKICEELKFKAQEKNLYLKFEKPKEKIPEISIDPEKIRQVILNLLDNAIKYTFEGGITIKIERFKNYVRIEIKDTGEGMEKKDLEKIFESFSRGETGRKYHLEGTGLGLYIAKKLVRLHKGKIWAESEGKGKGCSFYVELPTKLT